MTTATTSASSLVSRCAVCKIDRKGRFVYLDDETEKLLGLSQVELFAKPFADFLDPNDHETIDEITSQFNRYESFYDAATVTIIDSQGKRIPATVVVSLNFAAGNPVNYEIIINTAAQAPSAASQPNEENLSRDFLSFLKDVPLPSDSPAAAMTIVEALRNYTGARTVELYETSGGQLHPIATAGHQPVDPSCESVDKPEAKESSQNCLKTVLEISPEEEYLLRIAFDESSADGQLEQAREQAELATTLLTQALSKPVRSVPEYSAVDTFSLVDLLEKMLIGAALFDSEGHMSDHNERMRLILPLNEVSCLDDFSKKLAETGAADLEAHIRTYLETSDSVKNPPNLDLSTKLASGQPVQLTIIRLAPGSEDRSAYCIISPLETAGHSGAREPLPLGRRFVQKALDRLQSAVSAGLSVSQKLDHEHRSELTRDGGFYLNCLADHLTKTKATLDKLGRVASFAGEPDKPTATDLELLVDQILPELIAAYPQVKISLNKSSLPKITIGQKKLRTVLTDILTHLVAHSTGGKAGINIGATVNAKECNLRIKCDGAVISQSQLDQAFNSAGLGVTKELVNTQGGQLRLAKSCGKGSVLTVTLPIRGM
jgi:PAS domain S-box-containing protein